MHTLHKLLFAKLCTCYCVCLWFDQPSLKIPWVLCKSYLMLENLRKLIENLKFWENWVQNLCFWKTFHLILMHFILKIQCFEGFLHKTSLFFFFKNLLFLKFRLIEPIFQSNKIAIKNFGHPLSVLIDARLILVQSKHFRSIKPNFWSIENRIKSFFKSDFHVFKLTFQKVFKTFSLYTTRSRLQSNFFVVFLHSFCKVFLSQGR